LNETLDLKKWEKRRTIRRMGPDEVSVSGSGITIPREIVENHFDGGHVVVHYDDRLKILALEPETADNPDAYKMSPTYGPRSRSWKFTSKKIVRTLRVKPSRYKTSWNQELGVLLFEYEEGEEGA
jgi:hypothetical protein